MTSLFLLFLLIILVVLSGFLSGSETAITATSKARILYKKKKGSKRAGYVLELLDKKDNVISTLLLSNNLVNILASSLATAFFYDLFGVEGIFYATLIMTVVIVIFAEVLPKTYAINRPNRTALLIAPIIYYLNKILFIFVFVINLIVRLIFRKNDNDIKNNDLQSEEELKGVIDLYKTSNPDYEQEKDMLQSILQLNDITVEEIFTHRKNIYSIDTSLKTSEIIDKINNSRYTRIPFWKDNPENIIGLLNVRTLNIDLKNHNKSKEIIFDKISNPWFIPETTNLLEQLVEFKKRKEHLAFVVDEYGELLGIITLEDIIEEIVGEIVDEIDIPENDFKLNNYGKVIINGEKNIRDLYKSFDLDPPEIESSTIAGYILDISKKIPSYGESYKDNYFNFKILSHSKKQISKVEISKIS
ncbi:CNNM domain-containing protein [Pelagibacteraceae bacterium]|nr:CNNM domain-containing protein [Pelagibacteraceae bacterium]